MTNRQSSRMNDWIRQRMRERSPTPELPPEPDAATDTDTVVSVGGSAVDAQLRGEEDASLRTIATHIEFQRVIRRMRIILRETDGIARFVTEYTECMRAREGVFIPESWNNFCMNWLWRAIIEANISVDGIERLWFGIFHAANDEDFDQVVWVEAGLQDRLPPAYVQNLLRPRAPRALRAFTDPSLGEPYPPAATQPMSDQLRTLAALSSAAVIPVDDITRLPVFAELVTAVRGLVFTNGVRASSAIECVMDRLRMQFEPIEASDARIVNAVMQLSPMRWFIELLPTRTEAERALLLATFQSSISDWVPAATQPPCAIDQFVAHGTEYVRIRSLRSEIRAEVLIRSDRLDYVSQVLLMTTHRRNVMDCITGIWRNVDSNQLPLQSLSEVDFVRLQTLLSSPHFEALQSIFRQYPWVMAECQQQVIAYITRNAGERREEYTAGLRFLESVACQECVEAMVQLAGSGGRTVIVMLTRIVWGNHPNSPTQSFERWVQPTTRATELVNEFMTQPVSRTFETLDNMSLNCASFVLRVMMDAALGELSVIQSLTACTTHGLTDQHRSLSVVNSRGSKRQLDTSLFLGTLPDLLDLRLRRDRFNVGNWCIVSYTNIANGRSYCVHICEVASTPGIVLSAEEWAANWRTYWFPSMCEPTPAALEFCDNDDLLSLHEEALADLVERTGNGQHAPVPPTSEIFNAVVSAADEGMQQVTESQALPERLLNANANGDVIPPLTPAMLETIRYTRQNNRSWHTPSHLPLLVIQDPGNPMNIREVMTANPLRTFDEAIQAIEQSNVTQIGTPYEQSLLSAPTQQAVAINAVSRATIRNTLNVSVAEAPVQAQRVNAVIAAMQSQQEYASDELQRVQLAQQAEQVQRNNLEDFPVSSQQAIRNLADSLRVDLQGNGVTVTGGTITGVQAAVDAATPRPEFTGRVIQSTIRWDITNGQVRHSAHISELTNLLANSIPVPAGRDPNAASEVTVRPVNVHDTLSKLYDRSAGPSLFDLAFIAAYRRIHPVAETPAVADHVRVVQLRRNNDH